MQNPCKCYGVPQGAVWRPLYSESPALEASGDSCLWKTHGRSCWKNHCGVEWLATGPLVWVSPRHLCRMTTSESVQPSPPWVRTLQAKEVLASPPGPLAPLLSAACQSAPERATAWLGHLSLAPALVCSGLASAL